MANEKGFESMTAVEIVKEGVKKGVSEATRKRWFKRLISLVLAFCLGFSIGFFQSSKQAKAKGSTANTPPAIVVTPTPSEKPFTLTIAHVEEIISPASDLITTKYTYTDADTYESHKELFSVKLPLTTNKVVFTYSGNAGIGIDMSMLTSYLDNEGKTITIVLPELELKYNEIYADSFEYYNVSTSIFNQLKMADCTDLIATLLEEKEKQILNDKNIMDSARRNTELVLKGLLRASDLTKDYKVIFK